MQWLYLPRKRYGLLILNYMVTSNHIHPLVVDTGKTDLIPNPMKLSLDERCRSKIRERIEAEHNGKIAITQRQ